MKSDAPNDRSRSKLSVFAPQWLDLRWQLPLAVSVVALVLVLWTAAAYMIPLAVTVGDRVDVLASVSPSSLYGPDADGADGLDSLRDEMDDLHSDVSAAATAFHWMGSLSNGLSWVPIVERELAAWQLASGRAKADVEAAIALVAGADAMTVASESVGVAFTGNDGGGSNSAVGRATESAGLARLEFGEATDLLDRRWPRSDGLGIALLLPGVRSAVGIMGRVEDRMTSAADLGLVTTDLLHIALAMAEDARPIVGPVLGSGDSALPDPIDLAEALIKVRSGAVQAIDTADRLAVMLDNLEGASGLTADLADLSALLASVGDLSSAAGQGLEALRPLLDLAIDGPKGFLGDGDGLARALDALVADRDRLEEAAALATAVAGDLEALQRDGASSLLRGPLAELSNAARTFAEGLNLVSGLASIGGSLFGTDGERSYLVLGQSADELRPTGGFVSAVWIISLSQGALDQIEYFNVVRVDDWDRISLYPAGPPGLEEHMNGWVWLMRDVSWDPDFPTSAVAAQDIFNLGQRRRVDGVIAINQWGMLELVEALGSLPSPEGGDPITPRNFLSLLERGTDEHGRSYSDLVVRGLVDSLEEPRDLAQLLDVAAAMHSSLVSRDLLIHLNDERASEVLSQQGWNGELRTVDHDYLSVYDSNVGWSKVDRNIQRDVIYSVDLTNLTRPRASLRLAYRNHSGPGSSPCEPQWRSRGTDYGALKNACYWNYLRVLMPGGVRLLANTELPLPALSVSVESGFGVPGEETAALEASHGLTVFSGLTSVPAGTSRDIQLIYDLPSATLESEEGRVTYRLLMQKQPGVPRRGVSVELTAPDSYIIESTSHPPTFQSDTSVGFELSQTGDILLQVVFTSPTPATAGN